ncbi:hypothetical protein GGR54DRAFT_593599 [Hypoxylon sp. NC1633]|nr:hypothetical protein GGR54DRAFT_593599 [Hypoxylon sp. NC1633]
MATSLAATPDTLISLKVNYDGVSRRLKLPLRELIITTLEEKLRIFLQIPVDTAVTLERYSDSAASYVVLNSANIPAYKQLYRAAKAKQKLKLRVTTQIKPEVAPKPEAEEDKAPAPKPVSIEDEVEAESKEVVEPTGRAPSPGPTLTTPAPTTHFTEAPAGTLETIAVSEIHSNLPNFIRLWREHDMPRIHLRRQADGKEVVDLVRVLPASEAEHTAIKSELEEMFTTPTTSMIRCPFAEPSFQPCSDYYKVAVREAETKEMARIQTAKAVSVTTKAEEAEMKQDATLQAPPVPKRPFTVCCNSCDRAVPDAHFHCSTCDDGDFDLCQDCVNQGITCYGVDHWLIKRNIKDGQVNYSTTHIAPKTTPKSPGPQADKESLNPVTLPIRPAEDGRLGWGSGPAYSRRTCNCCVQDFPGEEFLHCTSCDDYDLCKECFAKDRHGHHPGHGFAPVATDAVFEHAVSSRLAPGRNVIHNAICDGCDKHVQGVRHKCLDCPDWDYCEECVQNADFIHPNHRFVAIYDPLSDRVIRSASLSTHYGICCDGPLCSMARGGSKYIVGVRYKCAVCHDTDFCANCETSPSNKHNKTHPMIKFKTPIRHVSVTTTGEHEDGQRLRQMGDRVPRNVYDETTDKIASSTQESISATPVQTVVDVQPVEQEPLKPSGMGLTIKEGEVTGAKLVEHQFAPAQHVAIFLRDSVPDGTILPPNHTFEQTWVLRNEGRTTWPEGCSVKFVGGDYMGAVDPTHPAGIHELVSASESTICYDALMPGQEFPFTVLMRTPEREGKVISYWRLTTADGVKFGHKLWCDVLVKKPIAKVVVEEQKPQRPEMMVAIQLPTRKVSESQMIIPKLEHESQSSSSSMHESAQSEVEAEMETDTLAQSAQEGQQEEEEEEEDDFEDCGEDDEWAESDEGFMTDEEYDILDASDEEYLSAEQHKVASKK